MSKILYGSRNKNKKEEKKVWIVLSKRTVVVERQTRLLLHGRKGGNETRKMNKMTRKKKRRKRRRRRRRKVQLPRVRSAKRISLADCLAFEAGGEPAGWTGQTWRNIRTTSSRGRNARGESTKRTGHHTSRRVASFRVFFVTPATSTSFASRPLSSRRHCHIAFPENESHYKRTWRRYAKMRDHWPNLAVPLLLCRPSSTTRCTAAPRTEESIFRAPREEKDMLSLAKVSFYNSNDPYPEKFRVALVYLPTSLAVN